MSFTIYSTLRILFKIILVFLLNHFPNKILISKFKISIVLFSLINFYFNLSISTIKY